MILPERVLGKPGANWILSGDAIGPMFLRTYATNSFSAPPFGSTPLLKGDEGVDALPLDFVGIADDRGFRDRFVRTSALSTSAVPMRWPETLTTSSIRPIIQ